MHRGRMVQKVCVCVWGGGEGGGEIVQKISNSALDFPSKKE